MREDNQEHPISPEDVEVLDRLIGQMNASTYKASAALGEALEYVEKSEQRLRKKYRLADLLAEMPEGVPLDDPEIREWMDMKPVGREFGA